MPYIPANCWPHNCAVERTIDGYHFLGTVDKYDTIEDVHLNLYNKNDFKNPVITVKNKDKQIVENNGNNIYPLIESTEPPYSINNQLIDLTLKADSDSSINNSQITIKEIFFSTERSGASNIDFTLNIQYIITEEENEVIEDTIKISITLLSSDFWDWWIEYYNKGRPEPKTVLINQYFPVTILGEQSQINKTLGGAIAQSKGEFYCLYYANSMSIPMYYSLTNIQISLDKYVLYLDFYANIRIGEFNMNTTSQVLSPIDNPFNNDFEFTTKNVNLTEQSSNSLSSYLNNASNFYWDFSLFGNKYDIFIAEGIFELDNNASYIIILAQENIEDGQQLNNMYYIKIKNNTKYLDTMGICSVTQEKTSGGYKHTIHFKENIGQLLKEYGTVELSFILGTQTFLATDLTSISNSNYDYTLKYIDAPLIVDSEDTIIQSIAYQFLRETTYLQVYTDPECIEEISNYNLIDTNYIIKTNKIKSQNFQNSIINPRNIQEFISFKNKTLNIRVDYPVDILKYHIKIYNQDNQLVHSEFNIYSSEINYNYYYALPSTEDNETIYKVELQIFEKNENFSKIFYLQDYITPQLDSKQYEFVGYGKNTKTALISLSNETMLPWYDSVQDNLWVNGEKQTWCDYYKLFDLEENIILALRATVYRYLLGKENNILEQQLIIQDLNLEPTWNNEKSFSFDNLLCDYGIIDGGKYQYEIFQEVDCLTPRNCKIYVTKLNEEYYFDLNYYYINDTIQNCQIKLYSSKNNELLLETFNCSINDNIITFSEYTANEQYNLYPLEGTILFNQEGEFQNITFQDTEVVFDNIIADYTDIETKTISNILSNVLTIDDWIETCVYGTKYNYDENDKNRYELDNTQIWYFNLDTKADTINYTNERNIFTNSSALPKVGLSKVNYMSDSITSKLGYLNEDDMYVEDNGQKLNKFAEWSNDGTIKILRLRQGFLIPVDIALKNNTANFTVVGAPSDVNFTWTQIGNHKDSVLYSIVKGENLANALKYL